jgi:5-oxoprolinase (ATP-hydrolysing) subunit A
MTFKLINLNADMGESFGAWSMGDDEALLGVVSTANIACGVHAGDPLVMRRTLAAARLHGVEVGAHPGYPDLVGFGRRDLSMHPSEIEAYVAYQIGALAALAACEHSLLSHVKPHGALYNRAWTDAPAARAIASGIAAVDRRLILLAPAFSELSAAGRELGLTVVDEVFADRSYREDGRLVSRTEPDAVLHDTGRVLAHLDAMLGGEIVARGGKRLPVSVGSICVHGDNPAAIALAGEIRGRLAQQGWHIVPLRELASARAVTADA